MTTDVLYRALPWTALILHSRHAPNDLNLSLSSRISAALVYGLIAALITSGKYPALLLVSAGLALAILLINFSLYRFFWRKRGWWFALRAVPCHWLYYGYSGLAFAYGVAAFLLRRRRVAATESSVAAVSASSTV